MDLEQMKAAWSTMDAELKQQRNLTNQMITDMIQLESKRKLSRIAIAEGLGIIMSIGMLIYLVMNFSKLNNWLTFYGGIALVIVLILAIAMGINIILKSQRIDLGANTYLETLNHFDSLKKLLGLYKWITIVFYATMPLFAIPVSLALFNAADVLNNGEKYWKAVGLSYLILSVILWLGFKFYGNFLSGLKKLIERKVE